jgi:hypothetical protein
MKAADQRLDDLVATMNAAAGMDKLAATAWKESSHMSNSTGNTNTVLIIIGTVIVVLLLVLVFGGGMMTGGMMD